MTHEQSGEARPWGLVGAAIVALLIAIGIVAIVGVIENEQVKDTAEHAIAFDVAIEDSGDDLQVAVLDLRHFHRDIVFFSRSDAAVANLDAAYLALIEEIDELEQIGVASLDIPQPDYLRDLAERYYADFRPSIVLFTSDPVAFNQASETGPARIDELEVATEQIDDIGEDLTGQSLARVESASTRERLVLLILLAGVGAIGAALTVTAGRVVSRLRAANAQEQAASHQLAEALRAKSDFIADASHELRTPLTLIRGNAEIALGAPEGAEQTPMLEEILRESRRMTRLVDDLLLLAQSDAGSIPMEREYVHLPWLLNRIALVADSIARHHGRCLTLELNGDGYLDADPQRIEQAVSIAVDNASKFAPEHTCVCLRSFADSSSVTFEIEDSGPGIPPEELPRIFDRFYQVGTRRARRKGGSGLGLAIARSIAEAHGGSIAIESEPGAGTRVRIMLPLSRQA